MQARTIKRVLFFLLLLLLGYGIYYAWFSFPIISGYSAKNACSCAFIQGRSKENIQKEELDAFPLSLGSIEIDTGDSSATGTVWGMARRKAIYREGFGCTLVNDFSEKEIRSQHYSLPINSATLDTMAWPIGDKKPNTIINGFNANLLDSAVSYLFHHRYKDMDPRTRALLVVYKGTIVAEHYAAGFNADSKFLGWSMAKTITGALIGLLVKEGKLNLGGPAPVPQWSSSTDPRHSITTEHLLQQRSGLDFKEDYSSHSNVTEMLFNQGDMAAYTAGLPLKNAPGAPFYYSSGNSNLLSYSIRRIVGEESYHAFPYQALFHKIGMYQTLLEPDASGTFVGSSYVWATARDYARFGLLYINDGVWQGERILPQGWVKQSLTPPPQNPFKNYGYQIWLNGMNQKDTSQKDYPEAPEDLFLADGFGGQRIYIIPSKGLVVVRMGLNMFDEHGFLRKLLASF
jgi:CubicO group peptidase (beta-lactamase class C family)